MPFSSIQLLRPTTTALARPSDSVMVPRTPPPAVLWKSESAGRAASPWLSCPDVLPAGAASRAAVSRAASTMARAIGCSEPASTAPASSSTSSSLRSARATTPSTACRPVVTVPVLSSTMVSTWRVSSRICGPLIRMPSCDARPVPVSSAVGVASPSAHGQAMTSTVTAAVNAAWRSPVKTIQRTKVMTAMTSTIGTKTELIRSASRAIGALPACAWLTSRPICASVVSEPTRVARTSSLPGRVDGGAGDGVVHIHFHRHGFTGEQGGVDGGMAVHHIAVGGDLLARPDHHDVAGDQVGGRYLLLGAVPQHGGVLGAQVQQGLQRVAGLLLGVGFQIPAQQQEGDDDDGDFEVQRVRGHVAVYVFGQHRIHEQLPGGEEEGGQHANATPACPWWRRNAGR